MESSGTMRTQNVVEMVKTAGSNETEKQGRGIQISGIVGPPKSEILFVIFCTFVAALGPFSLGYSIGFTSPTLPTITTDLNLNLQSKSIFSSIVNVGAMVGAVSGGGLAEAFGRRSALAVASVLFAIGWGCISTGTEIIQLSIGRVFTGVGAGIVSFAVPIYIAEIAPGNIRGSLVSAHQMGIVTGIFSVYTLGVFYDWRQLAFIGIYPSVIVLFCLLVIPETPRWIAKRGTDEDLVANLCQLRGKSSNIEAELNEIQLAVQESLSQQKATLWDLLKPDLRMPLIIGIGLLSLQQLTGINAVLFYAGTIFSDLGFSDPNLPGIAVQAMQLVTTILAASVLDRAGRRPMLLISTLAMALGCFALGTAFKLQEIGAFVDFSDILAFGSIIVYIGAFSIGLGPIPWVVMSEIFPANVRDAAGSLAVLIGWFCCFLVTLTFEDLLDWSSTMAFYLYGFVSVSTAIFVVMVVPETRGKTLEEIESLFKTPVQAQLA